MWIKKNEENFHKNKMSEVRFEPKLLSGTVDRAKVCWTKICILLYQNMFFLIWVESKHDYIIYFHSNCRWINICVKSTKVVVTLYSTWCSVSTLLNVMFSEYFTQRDVQWVLYSTWCSVSTLLNVMFSEYSTWQMQMGWSGPHWKTYSLSQLNRKKKFSTVMYAV